MPQQNFVNNFCHELMSITNVSIMSNEDKHCNVIYFIHYILAVFYCVSTAAEVHILSLLETIKQQQDQLVAKVNYLSSRLNSTPGPDVEMPDNIHFTPGTIGGSGGI